MVDMVARYAPASARVLDVGAGAGRLANLLAQRGYIVTGVEQALEFVAYANQHAVPGACFIPGGAAALPFAEACFEVVIASEVLEHLDDDAGAVKELFRVLVPGGMCVISVPADPHQWDASDEWAGHLRRYRPGELESLFTRTGFEVLRVVRWGFPFVMLYHRLVFLPMLARKRRLGDRPSPPASWPRRVATGLLSALFRLDRLWLGGPWGLGLVLVARKPAGPTPATELP
jgi:SAM-dependent methyltransferase